MLAVLASLTTLGSGCEPAPVPDAPPTVIQLPPMAQLVPLGALQPGRATKSNFGTFELGRSFKPDPYVAMGRAGGARNASNFDPSCSGWVSHTPDHVFVAETHYGSLRVLAAAPNDVTLVIEKPDGTFFCNDDGEGTNPVIGASFASGRYKVWVGSYAQGTETPYVLAVTERQSVHAATLLADANRHTTPVSARQPTPSTLSLRHGFMPDPTHVSGEMAARVPANRLVAACPGFTSSKPTQELAALSDFRHLNVHARSVGRRVGLIWQRHDGSFGCTPPQAEGVKVTSQATRGTHRFWVVFASGTPAAPFDLAFSEVRVPGDASSSATARAF